MVNLGSVALRHAERWPVLPLLPHSKRPATRSGLDAATQDLWKVRAWWERQWFNIGVRTGNGLLVVDLDQKRDISGFAELVSFASNVHGIEDLDWMQTYTVGTPNRGLHLYYRTEIEVRTRAGVLPGVDSRGERGYAVGAYSSTEVGRYVPESHYSEVVSLSMDNMDTEVSIFDPEVAAAPQWLLDLVNEERVLPVAERTSAPTEVLNSDKYLHAVLAGERNRIAAAVPGTRNDALYTASRRVGLQVRAGRIERDLAEEWLRDTAMAYLQGEDISDAANLSTIRSGLRKGSGT